MRGDLTKTNKQKALSYLMAVAVIGNVTLKEVVKRAADLPLLCIIVMNMALKSWSI